MNNKFDINTLVRPNIRDMVPYSSARDEFEGEARILLDANENSYGSITGINYNRYPDPRQNKLRKKVAEIKGIAPEQIFFGNGSDEPIDLLIRAFCQPQKDRILIFPPTYGMYKVQANINDTPVDEILLNEDFSLPIEKIAQIINPSIKLMFICSPNNPSGNLIDKSTIIRVLNCFKGIVIVDEAYIDFAKEGSLISEINNYPNLVVLQTFSKAWGMAALRLGIAFAQPGIIQILNKIKYPYNINILTQNTILEALQDAHEKEIVVEKIVKQRLWLATELEKIEFVTKVFPSDANFLLVRMFNATAIYNKLTENGIIVRNRSSVALCNDCLRITVGTTQENKELVEQLSLVGKELFKQKSVKQ